MKKYSYLTYIPIAILISAVLYIAMKPLVSLPTQYLIFDSVSTGILFSILSLLLKDIVRYGNYTSLPTKQCFINYIALAVLFVVCSVGLSYYILYLMLPDGEVSKIDSTIPVRIVIAFLYFGLIVLLFEITGQNESKTIDEESESETNISDIAQMSTEENESNTDNDIIEHIAVKNGQKIDVVLIPEIIYLQAEGDYVMIHSTKGKFIKEQTMKYFESHLPGNKFVRIHRSGIVNIDYIISIESYEKQNQIIILKNNIKAKVSISGYKMLKKTLNL